MSEPEPTSTAKLSSPRHVAVIMDGNGRWARKRSLPRHAGHRAGVKAVREIVENSARQGIEYLTLFAFSSENWRRPEEEVGMLMSLFLEALRRERVEAARHQGATWDQIGESLGMSRQSAWEYYTRDTRRVLDESAAGSDLDKDEAMRVATEEVTRVRRRRPCFVPGRLATAP